MSKIAGKSNFTFALSLKYQVFTKSKTGYSFIADKKYHAQTGQIIMHCNQSLIPHAF